MWSNFIKDENDEPKYPDISKMADTPKSVLNKQVEKMVNIGFLLGKKENRPKIKKTRNGFSLSFLMPVNSKPGDTITVPINTGNNSFNIVIRIPLQVKGNIPEPNDYLSDIPISREINTNIYDILKPFKPSKDVNLQFIPTFVKGSEYIYESADEDRVKDLDAKMVPSKKQLYFISSAKIVSHNGNKFKFKELGLFNKESRTLVFDLKVTLDLKLKLALPDSKDDSNIKKMGNKITEFIMNSSDNCPNYMDKVKEGFSMPKISIPKLINNEKKSDMKKYLKLKSTKLLLANQAAKTANKTRKRREKKFENFDSGLKSRIEARKKERGKFKIPKLKETGRDLTKGGKRTRKKKKIKHKKSRKRCN